jgi:hypothetical protein
MRPPPPDYEDVIEFNHAVPVTGDLGIQTFEQALIARLEPLKTVQDRIAAAILSTQQQILGIQQQTLGTQQQILCTRQQILGIQQQILGMQQQPHLDSKARSRPRSPRLCCRRFRSALGAAKRGLKMRARAYNLFLISVCSRGLAWTSEDAADAAEYRREAEWAWESGRSILECLKIEGDMDAVMDKVIRSQPTTPLRRK